MKAIELHNRKDLTKIVVTGGPCAGKTTGMTKIKEFFSKKGYTVLIMPETATELITAGISPTSLNSNYDYQLCQMKMQKYKESVYNDAVLNMPGEKFLIVCDRGMSDNKAYMTDIEFKSAVSHLNLTEEDILSGYDAIFHMVTAAKSPDGFYTLSNNCARTETKKEACDLDDRLILAWNKHSYFRIIDNTYSFEEKINNLISEIDCFLADRK